MAEVPSNTIPPQWREELPARSVEELRSRRRRRNLLIFLTALLAVGVGLSLVLTRLRPVPHPHFVPLWVSDYASPLLPAATPGAADRNAFEAADYFPHKSTPKWLSPDRTELRDSLTALRSRPALEPVVIYLSALAQSSGDSGVLLLPTDADPLRPDTALPLREVLEALAACPARHKLLVLDVMAPRIDPRLGLIANDLGAAVQADLNSVADPNRLVLCACSPGEVSLASEDLRRTVFGYYLDAGLRGAADGANPSGTRDRQVTVAELAAFVRARVERWTWHNLRARQTPVLLGDAADFPVVALGKGVVPEPPAHAGPEAYPKWLRDAWTARQRWWTEGRYRLVPHLFLRLDSLLLETERAWRHGADAAILRSNWEEKLSTWEKDYQRVLRLPPPASLSLIERGEGRKPNEFLLAAMRGEVNRLPSAGGDPKSANGAPRVSAGLLEKMKDATNLDVALAAFRLALDDEAPSAERMRILNAIVEEREPQPAFVETVLLRRLADLAAQTQRPWPAETVRLALETAAFGEQATAQPRAFPWIRAQLEEAAQARYEGELLLLTGQGYAPLSEADRAFKTAEEHYHSCLRRGAALADAYRTLDKALAFLPSYTTYLEAVPDRESAWQDAVGSARALADRLGNPPAEWEVATALAGKLEKQLSVLSEPFAAEQLASLRARCNRPGAQAAVLREVNAILDVPFLSVEDRLSLWQAGRDLAERLDEAVLTLDRDDGQLYEDPATDTAVRQNTLQKEEWRRAALRARCSAALLKLAGVNTEKIDKESAAFEGALARPRPNEMMPALTALETALAETWAHDVPGILQGEDATARDRMLRVLLPLDPTSVPRETEALPAIVLRTRRTAELASWRAERASYEAKDLANQGVFSSTLRRFYARLIAGFRPASPGGESSVEVRTEPRQLRLTPESPAGNVTVQVLPHGAKASETTLRLLHPDGDPLSISPDLRTEPRTLATGPSSVPVRIGINKVATAATVPDGILVEVQNRGRTYHSRLPISTRDVTDRIEILLGTSPQAPAVSLNMLAVRPLGRPQPFYLFLRNPSPRIRKLAVELTAGGSVVPGAQATTTLEGNETKLVSFAPSLPPPAAPTVAPPGPPKQAVELPELPGPLEIRLFDLAEKKQLVEAKSIRVEAASPHSYVEIVEARYIPSPRDGGADRKNLLEVTLRPTPSFVGVPCKVELVLPVGLMPSGNKGTFRGELTAGGPALRLTAEDLRLAPGAAEDGQFSLTVDGVERAFVFRATFAPVGDPTTPRELTTPTLRLHSSGYARPGDPRAVAIEVDNAPPGAHLDVRLGRIVDGVFVAEMTRSLPSERRRHIGFSPLGPAGALLFEASVADWTVPLDTSRVVGLRYLQVRLLDRDGVPLQTVSQALTFDDAPAQNVRFLDPPRYARRGATVTLKAAGTSTLSGIDKVLFFAGKPLNGKLPPDAAPVEGHPLDTAKTTWTATLPVPKDHTGPAEFSVQFLTRTGVPEFKTVVVEVTDADPAKLTPGRIVGTVQEGATPLAGLVVVLRDEKRKELARTTTVDLGRFTFENVLPGTYQLVAEKTKTPRRIGRAPVTVVADQDAVAPIKLYLP